MQRASWASSGTRSTAGWGSQNGAPLRPLSGPVPPPKVSVLSGFRWASVPALPPTWGPPPLPGPHGPHNEGPGPCAPPKLPVGRGSREKGGQGVCMCCRVLTTSHQPLLSCRLGWLPGSLWAAECQPRCQVPLATSMVLTCTRTPRPRGGRGLHAECPEGLGTEALGCRAGAGKTGRRRSLSVLPPCPPWQGLHVTGPRSAQTILC